MVKEQKITQIKFDNKNFNKGSIIGNELLEKSISKFGFREAATVDKNGVLIGGNKRTEKAGELGFEDVLLKDNDCSQTIVCASDYFYKSYSTTITKDTFIQIGSYPLDYNFQKIEPKYLIGMSVPPVMTAQIAHQIYLQWFKKGGVNG